MATVILNASTRKARAVDAQVFADHGNGEISICAYLRIRCETNKIHLAYLTPDQAEDLVSDLLSQLARLQQTGGA